MAHCAIAIVKKVCQKRSLCNSRCAIGIRDAENFKKGYMAHAVPLVFVANLFIKSTNISVCAMSRLNLVTFRFSVGCRGATGIVTKWCDLPPFSISHLHWVMWLSAAWCDLSLPLVVIGSIVFYFFFRIFFNIFVIKCIYKSLHMKNQCMTPKFHWG